MVAMRLRTRLLLCLVALVLAGAIWLPCVHLFFRPDVTQFRGDQGVSPKARKLARRYTDLWSDPDRLAAELAKMRTANAEWDFMGRSFLVWALANMAMRDESFQAAALEVMDRIIDETLRIERDEGMYFFLMPYAKDRPWVVRPARSQFVDGEIALMLGLRRLVSERADYKRLLAERVRIIIARMGHSPVLSAESYPDECWTFCNTIALAAIRVQDYLDGIDHGQLLRRWVATAREKLIDAKTGLLVAAYRHNGKPIYGPEGTTIWMATHCLSLIDEPFARRQYDLAKRYLARRVLGFGYSREWPPSRPGETDIDSGTVVPGLGLSVGASGNALVGAASFGDTDFYAALAASLEMGGFPIEDDAHLRYCASNPAGDALLLYSMTLGPAWRKVKQGPKP